MGSRTLVSSAAAGRISTLQDESFNPISNKSLTGQIKDLHYIRCFVECFPWLLILG